MSLLIIFNNAAAKSRLAWPIIRDKLTSHSIEFDSYQTQRPGDAGIQARQALLRGVNTIAIVGGDGTLSEAAEGFFQFNKNIEELPTQTNEHAALAILPAGTGDDFARGLTHGVRAPLNHWIDLLISHCRSPETTTHFVDVLYGRSDNFASPFICLNASTMGIGGETAKRVAAQGNFMRRFSGEARFASAALIALAKWRERRVRVTLDNQVIIDASMNLAAVANALYAGGGMMLSPQAQLDDGKLDVVTASGLNRAEIVRELTRIHKGGHIVNPKVSIHQGETVSIETFSADDAMPIEADGNVRGKTPVEFRVMPRALRFLTPESRVRKSNNSAQ